MRNPNYYKKSISLLEEIHKSYTTFTIGRHISTALSDYGDFWGIPDKEFFFALEKYLTELSIDNMSISEAYIERIIKDAENLDSLLMDDEEEEDDYGSC